MPPKQIPQLTGSERLDCAAAEPACWQAATIELPPVGDKRRLGISMLVQAFSRVRGSQLNRNMGAGSAAALAASFLSFISYPIYLHYLGYHTYGLWLVLGVIASVAQIGNLGIPWALVKLVAEERGRGDWEGIRIYINLAWGIILTVGVIFVTTVTLSRHSIVQAFKLSGADAAAVYATLPYFAMFSVLVVLFYTLNASLGGLGRMDLSSYNETAAQSLAILISAVLLILGLRLWAMILGTLSAYFVAQVIAFVQVQRLMPMRLIGCATPSREKLGRLLGTGGWILISGICTTLMLPFSRLMLSRYAGVEVVALNDLCIIGSFRAKNIFDAAFRPTTPEVSATKAESDAGVKDRIRTIDRQTLRIAFILALPCFVGLFAFINPFLHFWLQKSFNPLLPNPFRIALIGAFIGLLGSPAYYMLIGFGNVRDSAASSVIQVLVNASILILLAVMGNRITVAQSTISFAAATAASTLYLRVRIYILARRGSATV